MDNVEKLTLFMPLQKVDIEKREVWGVLAEERKDKSDEVFDYESSKPLFLDWNKAFMDVTQGQSMGNLRSMHKAVAAGKFISMEYDDENKRVVVGAKVVDEDEWQKVVEGVYTGFSIGGKYLKKWYDSTLNAMKYTAQPCEGSLVDNPCMYGATFTIVKAEGIIEEKMFKGEGSAMDGKTKEELEKEVNADENLDKQDEEVNKETNPDAEEKSPADDVEKADKKEEEKGADEAEDGSGEEQESEDKETHEEEAEKGAEGEMCKTCGKTPCECSAEKLDKDESNDDLIKAVDAEVKKAFEAYTPKADETLTKVVGELTEALEKVTADFEKFVTANEELSKTVETLTTQNEELSKRVKELEDAPADGNVKLMAVTKGIGGDAPQANEVDVLRNLISKTEDLAAKQALSIQLAAIVMKDVYKGK